MFYSARVLESLFEARRAAAVCAAAPAWAVPDEDLIACLTQAWAGVQQMTTALAHLVHQAKIRGVPRAHGTTSTAVWLREQLRVRPGAGKHLVKLAHALNSRPVLDDAMAAGNMSADQATTIAATLRDLPDSLGRAAIDKAESMLIDWAGEFDPITMGRMGTMLLEYVAPEAGEAREKAYLDRQEKAYGKRGFTMSPIGDGMVRLSGYLDVSGAATVNAALDPLCHPRRDPAGERSPKQRRADALVDVCAAALRGDANLPTHGGDAAQVVVTIPFSTLTDQLGPTGRDRAGRLCARPEQAGPNRAAQGPPGLNLVGLHKVGLVPVEPDPVGPDSVGPDSAGPDSVGSDLVGSDLAGPDLAGPDRAGTASPPPGPPRTAGSGAGVGWLDTGEPISAAEARRLACDARIIPAVLGGDSQVLDLGRARRLFTGPVRRALILRDRGCIFPSCDRPPRWTEGHHIRSWPTGGVTEPANGCLVCRHHHRLLHNNSGWQVRMASDGHPEFLPPTTIDPERRPRRNIYHRRD